MAANRSRGIGCGLVLGVFASFYLSSTIISNSRLYGTIGVVFDLLTWFFAIGGVLMLGAVGGVSWNSGAVLGTTAPRAH